MERSTSTKFNQGSVFYAKRAVELKQADVKYQTDLYKQDRKQDLKQMRRDFKRQMRHYRTSRDMIRLIHENLTSKYREVEDQNHLKA